MAPLCYFMGIALYTRNDEKTYRQLNPAEACEETGRLLDGKKSKTRIFIKDGDIFHEIDSKTDFERACVLKGIFPESLLSDDERKALPIMKKMMERGDIFTEKHSDKKAGALSILKAVGQKITGVDHFDASGKKSEIKSLKDLERIDYTCYGKNPSSVSPEDRRLLDRTLWLMKKGISFVDAVYDRPLGAPLVVKAALGEDRGFLRESVFFQDDEGRHSQITSTEDLRRIKSIYFDSDLSRLPEKEQEIILSLKRIFDRKSDQIWISTGLLGFMKEISENSPYGVPIDIKDRDAKSDSREKIRTLRDVDRFLALYLDKDPKALPPDEREAVSLAHSLRESGIDFRDRLGNRIMDIGLLQVLKGEDPFENTIWLHPGDDLPRISNLEDLKRLDALVIKKDPGLLCKDEEQIVRELRELKKRGIIFKGSHGRSEISIIKSLKGELGVAFVVHSDNKESLIDEPLDFERIKALYVDKDENELPRGEKDVIENIHYMQEQGYSCALAFQNRIKDAEPFDVLKSTLRNYPNVGFIDMNGAFTSISSALELNNLRAVHSGKEPDSLTTEELRLLKNIQSLQKQGYTFQAILEFRPQHTPGLPVPEAHNCPIGPLQVMKELRKENENLWAVREGEKTPISRFINAMEFFDRIQVSKESISIKPPENTIIEFEDFVIVGGVKLPSKKGGS